MDIINFIYGACLDIINFISGLDLRAWAIFFSALVAFWGYVSSLRPYMHAYLSFSKDSKANMTFNIANKGKVGAKKVRVYSENYKTIHRFTEETAMDGKPLTSNSGGLMDLKLPVFHKHEMVPPDFHYETFLGRGAGKIGNEKLAEPFVVIIQYKSSLPVVSWIPYVGRFKEKFYLNPRMFDDVMGINEKEIIDIDLSLTKNTNRITGQAVRRYPS